MIPINKNTRRLKFIFIGNILFLLMVICFDGKAQLVIPFEQSNGQQTATVQECLKFYYQLASGNPDFVRIQEPDLSSDNLKYHDAGLIKLVHITNFKSTEEKIKLFINNGIHPGEPDGIDACMVLARDLLSKPELKSFLDAIDVYIIPVYNTGGAQKRGCCSRANQDGPASYGFRGNDLNLDLNRDFMKCDALETQVLEAFFHQVKPNIFIDTHVSDGADYQYIMTLISSQHNKYQNQAMETFQKNILLPNLYGAMAMKNEEMCPYVNFESEIPDSGITGFMDGARFSSGYASLFNCYSFTAETHMLKPFAKRVRATYTLLLEFLKFASERHLEIANSLKEASELSIKQNTTAFGWMLDTNAYESISFKGYQAYFGTSEVTHQRQLYYDRNRPFTKSIRYYNTYLPVSQVNHPKAYVIPYEWFVKLNLNRYNLNYSILHDTTVFVSIYSNLKYTLRKNPYEGNLSCSLDKQETIANAEKLNGHWVMIDLKSNSRYKRFLVEALEPGSPEGYFAWGKMLSMLQQKEGFSDYVWDKRAENILKNDANLNTLFLEKRKDPAFASDRYRQLDFIYQHSRYFEKSYLKYPIYRIEN